MNTKKSAGRKDAIKRLAGDMTGAMEAMSEYHFKRGDMMKALFYKGAAMDCSRISAGRKASNKKGRKKK